MNKKITTYNGYADQRINFFLQTNYGEPSKFFYDNNENYIRATVHSFVGENLITYATVGMGARGTAAQLREFTMVELIAQVAKRPAADKFLATELQNLAKIPFETKSWFGPGQIVGVSDFFRDQFGYEAFILYDTRKSIENGNYKVRFLQLIPIFKEEKDWILQNDTFIFLDRLFEKCTDEEIFLFDIPREHIIPEGSIEELQLMRALDVDRKTMKELFDFLKQRERFGKEINQKLIDQWLEANRK